MWVVVALASLLLLAILALSVPLDAVLHVDIYGRPKFRMRLAWLFGLVGKEVTGGEKRPKEKKPAVEGQPKPGKKGMGVRAIVEILRTRGLFQQVKYLLKGILRCLQIRDLGGSLQVGLGDPADTGFLFAVIGPATQYLRPSFLRELKLEPSFADGVVCEGYLDGAVRCRPIQLVPPVLRFTFSLATIRVAKRIILTKWKRRK
ncbi:hypothetical protein ACFLYR_01870 [Chloroflexota bacterium]